jgi:hypothetical protein
MHDHQVSTTATATTVRPTATARLESTVGPEQARPGTRSNQGRSNQGRSNQAKSNQARPDNKVRLSSDILAKAELIAQEWGLKNARAAVEAVFRRYSDSYLQAHSFSVPSPQIYSSQVYSSQAHSLPVHSLPAHSLPVHSIAAHSVSAHSLPAHSLPAHTVSSVASAAPLSSAPLGTAALNLELAHRSHRAPSPFDSCEALDALNDLLRA